ncbi:thioredoxin domain-containing protein [Brevundimonas variabilis]|uniref:Protein-disulfide isomerase n=1 Tax=Brevundimonas variabilis TaxID=74312 RepID=A0A7W9CJF2_9CAUL|nr:thioredoxin domain-containing protein [Brevundimonas variabilis]MBB5746523.1 protein-disulfide isomerase [Brevundimonas variabilis]
MIIRRLLIALCLGLFASVAHAGPLDVTASDRVLGRADAPVTVVEYASFTCPHCADWHNTVLPDFKARFIDTGKVRLVFRDLPTDPVQVAATAAAIARCAAPDRFYAVASSFMSGQAQLRSSYQVGPWYDAAIAVSGKTPAQIETCLADPATMANLRAGMEAASAAGVQSTPSFFVNGRAVQDRTLDGLSSAITPLLP